jgi:hypothetical protein
MRKNIACQLEDGRELECSVEIFRGRVRFRIWLVDHQVIVDLLRRDFGYFGPVQLTADGQSFAAEFSEMTGAAIPQNFGEELTKMPALSRMSRLFT